MRRVFCCYPGGKFKALTFSYDDGTIHDRRLVEIFNQNGCKGSFHLNSGLMTGERKISPEEAKTLYQGHEISCHTVTHPTIERCPLTTVMQELLEDRKALEKIAGYPVTGLSYPNGSYSDEIVEMLPMLGIKYARVTTVTENIKAPRDFYRWEATCHHRSPRLMELGQQLLDHQKHQYLRLMYVWGHSYEFNTNDNWYIIEDFCRMMGGKDDIWYCTNLEYVQCMENFKRLEFAADNSFVYNPSAAECWIRVNDQIICIPGGATVELPE